MWRKRRRCLLHLVALMGVFRGHVEKKHLSNKDFNPLRVGSELRHGELFPGMFPQFGCETSPPADPSPLASDKVTLEAQLILQGWRMLEDRWQGE